jgi:Ca2+:H+ antiporter
MYFVRYTLKHFLGTPQTPEQLAKGRSIDTSIQFLLLWLPILIMIAWAIGKPLHLLFDVFEVGLLFGTCFMVNTVTADAKTNWIEGLVLVGLYIVIVSGRLRAFIRTHC